MMERAGPYLILIGRVLLSVIFIQSGWSKIFGYAGTVEHMQAAGVPGALLPLVILTELGGGILVLLGFLTRWAAIALAGFCVLAGYLFHYYPGDMGQMINFMKNLTIAGGFLVLAGSGPGAFALDNRSR
jgi:putative oxidoreductase